MAEETVQKDTGKETPKTPGSTAQGRGRMRRNTRRRTPRERTRPEFEHKVIDVRRVTRVVAGGRRFSFSVTLVAGNRKGSVGVGIGKAGDTALAIEKAMRDAKRHMIQIPRTDTDSIPHEVGAKYASVQLKIFPAPGKGGLTAGSAVRIVLELAGIKAVGAKILSRTKNKVNIARAAILALKKLPGAKDAPVAHAPRERGRDPVRHAGGQTGSPAFAK
ncbi:30S ribosomal protein S5 [Candidatus Wolfebacteria bacterium]|nr:30S ribosomal protein S5 [Candidatus Wolfebacteria bacterium]